MIDLIPLHFAHRIAGVAADGYLSGEDWLQELPGLLRDLLAEWELEPTGRSLSGSCSVVVPVRLLGAGRGSVGVAGEAVLKVSWPHPEAATEALALQTWNGHGAVRLVRADPSRFALLLERVDVRDLVQVEIDEACTVIGQLITTLRRPAHPRIPRLDDYASRQADELRAAPPVIPRRYLDQAAALARELVVRPPAEERLLHTDLHFANVLAARRTPWLAIDPKPMAGDPAFEVAPALWNRAGELGTGSQVRWSLRRRLEIICERAGIDEGRARAWTIVREADNALEAAGDPGDPAARDRVSLAVMIIKAMND
ncbi:aminoglycoside phosphotransferase family protein [Intrasporangium calvum]|uniref:6-kinase n=1 Tax=Intrasporangium calvum (strain ATCC 23552 / DSM 43043 / JCM 3097 / NBRC 12989 / NCIMB 10167 / NRRL B-3866 / 7 KIP) TaxID=710696 RepID=E6SE91_INTC7|nr:aminoglycoside phosphotransferase family protein [Intrasporangium calvum]ADU48739.1 6-kinase [Intrasporangium calvum DSM 43043]